MSYYTKQKNNQKPVQGKEDFVILSKAKALMKYTLHQNCKKNSKSLRYTVYAEIIKTNMDIIRSITYANNALQTEYDIRIKLQSKAISDCDILSSFIECLVDIGTITSHDCEVWSKQCCNIKHMIMGWRKKTKENKDKAKYQLLKNL